jgi:hypothetical protein
MGRVTDDPWGTAGDIGSVLGSGAESAAAGRRGDSDMRARNAMINNRAMVDASVANRGMENDLMRQTMLNRLRSDVQPWQSTDPRATKFRGTGGMSQTLGSPVMRAMTDRFSQGADEQLRTGSYKVVPERAELQEPGALERIGGTAGTVGGILDILRRRR